ncbi:hypothetical protein J6590_038390 [Homalodisca vitripennis]|nr:hypothetical protein J6590_038390 [Homalodisca vitripennis]
MLCNASFALFVLPARHLSNKLSEYNLWYSGYLFLTFSTVNGVFKTYLGPHIFSGGNTSLVLGLIKLSTPIQTFDTSLLSLARTRPMFSPHLLTSQIQGGAKSAHEHGQGAELGLPYSKRVLIQGMDGHDHYADLAPPFVTSVARRASNLTRLWSVMSSPATASYMSFSDNGSPMPSSLQHTSLYPHKFTVTPADVNSTPN